MNLSGYKCILLITTMAQRKMEHFHGFFLRCDPNLPKVGDKNAPKQNTSPQVEQQRQPLAQRSASSQNKRKQPPHATKSLNVIPFKKMRVLATNQAEESTPECISDTNKSKKPQTPDISLPVLPNKCLCLIFSCLSLRDLNQATKVCKRWQTVGNNNGFWKKPLVQRYTLFPWFKKVKLRPMGVCKHLFNSPPLQWGSSIPPKGAYIWHISFTQLSRSQDKLQELMGVGKFFIRLGLHPTRAPSRQRDQQTSITSSSRRLQGSDRVFEQVHTTESILFLVNRVIGMFCVLPVTSIAGGESNIVFPWKKLPRNEENLIPLCETNSAALELAIRSVTGKETVLSIAMPQEHNKTRK